MAKSRNNLLGVGGQRKKMSRADQQGSAPARAADRRAAEDQKQELLRKMRERAQADETGDQADQAGAQADETDAQAGSEEAGRAS
ncbi:hypothetical protein AMK26_02550 [Streptomyces sp. CB03234]|uniref:DUF6243 family protein n=1 Tax=Streptomyces sp. (strain CB03234) TaxID=1703937 RepID=UPI00093FBBCA|nr:DUF6243 family protein [Streptomyces sp. CB03234]OKK07954.1 hypothetical protein AMK26_02550 [Streptomyces sp. CB03234]